VLPIRATMIDVSVSGVCVKVSVTKKFQNHSDANVDAFFTFKMDNVSVVSFECTKGE
jgi:hypothetical protein